MLDSKPSTPRPQQRQASHLVTHGMRSSSEKSSNGVSPNNCCLTRPNARKGILWRITRKTTTISLEGPNGNDPLGRSNGTSTKKSLWPFTCITLTTRTSRDKWRWSTVSLPRTFKWIMFASMVLLTSLSSWQQYRYRLKEIWKISRTPGGSDGRLSGNHVVPSTEARQSTSQNSWENGASNVQQRRQNERGAAEGSSYPIQPAPLSSDANISVSRFERSLDESSQRELMPMLQDPRIRADRVSQQTWETTMPIRSVASGPETLLSVSPSSSPGLASSRLQRGSTSATELTRRSMSSSPSIDVTMPSPKFPLTYDARRASPDLGSLITTVPLPDELGLSASKNREYSPIWGSRLSRNTFSLTSTPTSPVEDTDGIRGAVQYLARISVRSDKLSLYVLFSSCLTSFGPLLEPLRTSHTQQPEAIHEQNDASESIAHIILRAWFARANSPLKSILSAYQNCASLILTAYASFQLQNFNAAESAILHACSWYNQLQNQIFEAQSRYQDTTDEFEFTIESLTTHFRDLHLQLFSEGLDDACNPSNRPTSTSSYGHVVPEDFFAQSYRWMSEPLGAMPGALELWRCLRFCANKILASRILPALDESARTGALIWECHLCREIWIYGLTERCLTLSCEGHEFDQECCRIRTESPQRLKSSKARTNTTAKRDKDILF